MNNWPHVLSSSNINFKFNSLKIYFQFLDMQFYLFDILLQYNNWLIVNSWICGRIFLFRHDCLFRIEINSLMDRFETSVLQQGCLGIYLALFWIVGQALICWSNFTRFSWIFGLKPVIRYALCNGEFPRWFTQYKLPLFVIKNWHTDNFCIFHSIMEGSSTTSQPAITCSKSIIKTSEQGVKYIQS